MDKKAAEARLVKLRELINRYRYEYHVLDRVPDISEEALDSLKDELRKLEEAYPDLVTPDSPSQRVAGEPLPGFQKITHVVPQWSFNDAFTEEDIRAFAARVQKLLGPEAKPTYICELKIDGLKIVLTYERGQLKTAATRGDGRVGEDVTANVRTIESVPLVLARPVDVIVEGEVWLGKKRFAEINQERIKTGEELFANTRNMAAGTLRQLDPQIVAVRRLDTFIYDLAKLNGELGPRTQQAELEFLRALGFKVNSHYEFCPDVEAVIAFWRRWQERREEMDYGLDGVVVKVNEHEYQERLGYTGKAPRFGIAFKFRAEEATTVVKDIVLQVGRTGVVTPVAVLEPVFLAGSTISRATLHNEDEIRRLDVRIGDTVVIRKAGDVIPDIVKVLPDLRRGTEKVFHFPKTLEACGGAIERIPGEAAYRCVNRQSFVQLRRRFHYFASKNAFNIVGLGPKIIDQLLEAQLVATFDDLFTLKLGDLLNLPRFGEKSAEKLLVAIEKARSVTLSRFVASLSIPQVGEETAFDLARHFKKLEKIETATRDELQAVAGVGTVVAEAIVHWFGEVENKQLVSRLLKQVKIISDHGSDENFVGTVAGKTFVLTGTLPTLSRDEAKEKIRAAGGQVASSVSKATDYVVAGLEPGSKLERAQALGIPVLEEAEFLKLFK